MDDLRAIRRLSPEEAQRQSVRARYGAGRIGERRIPAYVDEEGVDPDRGTETFAPHEFSSRVYILSKTLRLKVSTGG